MKALWKFLLIVCLAIAAFLVPSVPAAAQQQTLPALVQTQSGAYQQVIPDFNNVSFASLGNVEQGGNISFQGVQRQWQAGDPLSDVLTIGDVSALGGQSLSLGQINQITGTNFSEGRLSTYPLIQEQTLENLTGSIPYLGDYKVGEVAPIQQLLSEQTGQLDFGNLTLNQFLSNNPGLKDLKLEATNLDIFKVADLPNIDSAQIANFKGWDEAKISDVPGLQHIPLSQFPNGITGLNGIVSRIDFIWGPTEDHRTNTISGSYQAGFAVPCSEEGKLVRAPDKCAYIELDDLEDEGRKVQGGFEGKQWISGKYHEVEGGFGPLRYVPSPMGYSTGYEPTGRHPFGSVFKLVVWESDETTDEVSFKLFFRWCTYIPVVGRTCTPYNQFSIPWLDYEVNSLLYVGPLDGQGGASTTPAPPPGTTRYPGSQLSPITTGPCTGKTIAGVSLDKLANSLAAIESRGSGNYQAVGVYVQTSYASGRALGRYQMMSYLPEVQAAVKQISGGQAWLNRIERGYRPSAAEVSRYFPEPVQESAYQSEMQQLFTAAQQEIDPQTGRAFTGGRLIERVTQMWFGGPSSTIDGGGSDDLGRLSIYDYGVQARQNYVAQGGQNCVPGSGGGSGKATGNFANPAPGYVMTSDFGRRPKPCAGCSSFHPAVDLGTPTGTPVNAADGGVVSYVGRRGGYGKTVVVDHGNGYQTRYSHLSGYNVSVGDAVSQGQQIAASGSTGYGTGPHLDFGIYQSSGTNYPRRGTAVNPENFINF